MTHYETLQRYKAMTNAERAAISCRLIRENWRALLVGPKEVVDRRFERINAENDARNRNMLTAIARTRNSSMHVIDVNYELRKLYEKHLDAFLALAEDNAGLNWPHFIRLPEQYAKSTIRLMVVGQQTAGWGKGQYAGIDEIVNEYKEFNLGAKYRSTPFWSAARELDEQLNEANNNGYVWSNINKVAQRKTRPTSEVELAVAKHRLLEAEIRICKPEVVVFFTGPRYDELLKLNFAGSKFDKISNAITKVTHSSLPDHSYRTFHPKYLRMSKQWNVLDEIVAMVKCNGT